MKFATLAVSAIAMVATLVSAQDAVGCTLCLQKALQALPACANITPTPGNVSAEFAACLCSSLTGTWIDSCKGSTQCGSSVSFLKAAYAASIQAAGLSCTGTPSYTPVA